LAAHCPRCGFGSALTEEQQWGKLEVIQRVADEVWA
jgi:ribosomal protein L37E